MNTILTLILIALIVVALMGSSIVIALVRSIAKKNLKLRKERKTLLQMRKSLESAIAEVEALQQRVIDQAVTVATKDMEALLKSMLKDE